VNQKDCKFLVCKMIESAGPLLRKSCRQLERGDEKFRIRPDEYFKFPQGHLLIEYEQTKRPVESISKYWWLLHNTTWLRTRERIVLVLFLFNDYGNPIRSETINTLGCELEKSFPGEFTFFFLPPNDPNEISESKVRDTIKKALIRVVKHN